MSFARLSVTLLSRAQAHSLLPIQTRSVDCVCYLETKLYTKQPIGPFVRCSALRSQFIGSRSICPIQRIWHTVRCAGERSCQGAIVSISIENYNCINTFLSLSSPILINTGEHCREQSDVGCTLKAE